MKLLVNWFVIRDRSDNKDTERDKMKQNFVSKTSNSHYTPANPKLKENMQSPTARKRPPLLSSSSENEDSESSSSKPPPSKTPNFRSSKSSESDTPDIPKTPGPSSTAPSLWGDLDVDLKNETTKSSKPKITASPYRKVTYNIFYLLSTMVFSKQNQYYYYYIYSQKSANPTIYFSNLVYDILLHYLMNT